MVLPSTERSRFRNSRREVSGGSTQGVAEPACDLQLRVVPKHGAVLAVYEAARRLDAA